MQMYLFFYRLISIHGLNTVNGYTLKILNGYSFKQVPREQGFFTQQTFLVEDYYNEAKSLFSASNYLSIQLLSLNYTCI